MVFLMGNRIVFASSNTYINPAFTSYQVCLDDNIPSQGQSWAFNIDTTQHYGGSGSFGGNSNFYPLSSLGCNGNFQFDVTSGRSSYTGERNYITLTNNVTGDTFWTDFAVTNPPTAWNNITYIDDFTPYIYLPDNTNVLSGYDYIGNDFGNINIILKGINHLGLYDHFYLKIYENDTLINDSVSFPINLSSNTNIELSNFLISDTGLTYRQGYDYLFVVTYGSELADSIVKSFHISWDILNGAVVYEDCNTTDIACYIKNSLRWAFTVPPSTFDKFTGLKDSLITKAPFGYITSAYTAVLGINDTNPGLYTMETVTPITNTIFNPIRLALSWLFYLIFLFGLIKNFRNINI